jgi:hypothetical protein
MKTTPIRRRASVASSLPRELASTVRNLRSVECTSHIATLYCTTNPDGRCERRADAYHGKYSLERQATQDEIVRNMLSYEDVQTGRPSPGSARATFARAARGAKMLQASRQPWAIFTAGCVRYRRRRRRRRCRCRRRRRRHRRFGCDRTMRALPRSADGRGQDARHVQAGLARAAAAAALRARRH